ncbi:MAG: DNA polymerase III subunit [Defluviitaleaceae bacterium]|nr:DNA polymerase III subunit [Defluviitaleaceae bacterium]
MHSFDHILGNEMVKRSMVQSIGLNRLHHSYIIAGSKGSGKKTLANAFAKSIVCAKPKEGLACGACKPCVTFDSGNNPDIVYIKSEKATLGVGEVREQVLEGLSISPHGKYRVYIIQDAHKMTPAAQNAMLLTLEEGPKHTIFLLLTENIASFLPTVLSRCIKYQTAPLGSEVVREHLEKMGADGEKAKAAISLSKGYMGQAIKMAIDEDFIQMYNWVVDVAKGGEKDIVEIFKTAKDMEQYKDNIFDVLEVLKNHYRGQMVEHARNGQGASNILAKIKIIIDTEEKLKTNCNFLLCMETMLLGILSPV